MDAMGGKEEFLRGTEQAGILPQYQYMKIIQCPDTHLQNSGEK